jgi:O-antigen ligase
MNAVAVAMPVSPGVRFVTRGALITALLALGAATGALAALRPAAAIGLCGVGLALALAFRAPVVHLLALVVVTAIVPLAVQSRYGSGGSAEAAGLIPSDVLMLAGLARAAVALPHQRLDRRSSLLVGLTLAFLVVVALQLAHAVGLGRPLSGSGSEVRALLGFGTVLVALPILCDPRARARLARSLVGLGIVLGAWGVAQYALDIRFDVPGDLGASSTSSFTTAGRVVGMYAFMVAAIVALAALTSGTVRGRWARAALAGVLALNCIAIVVTFERTFMVATLIGFAALFVRGGVAQRRRLAVWAPAAVVVTGLALAALAPSILSAAGGRLASLGDYGTDASVAYRVAESRLVGKQIRARPLIGSGLGATIQTGRPNTTQPIRPRRYAENGYLWLGWKLGIPGAAVLWLLLGLCIAWPVSRLVDAGTWGLVSGCQAALTALAVATIAFPSFNQLAITPILGAMAALCVAPPAAAAGSRREART